MSEPGEYRGYRIVKGTSFPGLVAIECTREDQQQIPGNWTWRGALAAIDKVVNEEELNDGGTQD